MGTDSSDEPPRAGLARRSDERGQTTLDFAIGVSVFLAVLVFIFLFIPGILSPFTESAQDETVASNRVADQLAAGTLASPSEPYVLDTYCTVAFFRNNSADCSFPEGPLEAQLGVDTAHQQVNVSLRGNRTAGGPEREFMCWDGTGDDTGVVEVSNPACDPDNDGNDRILARGDPVPTDRPSVTSVRVVSIDGVDVTLFVEMW